MRRDAGLVAGAGGAGMLLRRYVIINSGSAVIEFLTEVPVELMDATAETMTGIFASATFE